MEGLKLLVFTIFFLGGVIQIVKIVSVMSDY